MSEEKLVTQKQYGDHRGISRQAVSRLIKTGRIPSEHGRIDLEAADKALASDETQTGGMTLSEAVRRKEGALARLRELEFEMKSGKYVDTEFATEMAARLTLILRSIVLQMPSRAVTAISDDAIKRPVFAAATRARNDLLRQLAGATHYSADAKLCPACTAKVEKAADKYQFPPEAFPYSRNSAAKVE